MIYLASPYSDPDPTIVKTRVGLTMQCMAALIQSGHLVWSPILHCHEMAHLYRLPTDAKFWRKWAKDFIRRCDAMYVLQIPGTAQSQGVNFEIAFAKECDIPVYMIDENGTFL